MPLAWWPPGRRWPPREAAAAGGAEFPTAKQFAESKEAQAHVAAAMKIGGSDMAAEAKWFCTATGPQRVALARQAAGLPRLEDRPLGPIKLFDNLYYIGFNDVGAWAVPTSAGIILFDTLNSTDEPRCHRAGDEEGRARSRADQVHPPRPRPQRSHRRRRRTSR